MKSLHLKDLPDEVRERLERLAQREHMSVSAFAVRELTELSRRADNPDLLGDLPDSEVRVEDILADLDEARSSRW